MSTIVTRSGKGSPLTHAEVDSNFTNLNTDKLELSGGTLTGTLNFGDNVKAQFGASADLQVYHNGTNSVIVDNGAGNLSLQSNGTEVNVWDASNGQFMAKFIAGAQTVLYHNGSTKLSTTSTGIDVTGTVVADGATIGESTANTTVTVGGSYANGIELAQNGIDATSSARLFFDSTTDASAIYNSGGDLTIAKAATVGSSSGNKSMTLGSNGDISFYEDTGTTAKFFWDASTERLGIGTTVPSDALHVADGGVIIHDSNGNSSNSLDISYNGSSGLASFAADSGGGNTDIRFTTSSSGVGAERLRIRYNGNVGIGTSSPSRKLTVEGGSGDNLPVRIIGGTGTTKSHMEFQDPSTTADYKVSIGSVGDNLTLQSGGSESARLDASGNLEMTGGGSIGWANWTITESGGSLYFATGGTNKMKLDASGNLDVVGSVNANATIT